MREDRVESKNRKAAWDKKKMGKSEKKMEKQPMIKKEEEGVGGVAK
jgi:hypothetical protein